VRGLQSRAFRPYEDSREASSLMDFFRTWPVYRPSGVAIL
jgi:hypothetical protein